MSIFDRIKHAWNAFLDKKTNDNIYTSFNNFGYGSYINPYKSNLSSGKDKTIIASIFNRIATDCSMIDIRHIRVDENENYKEDMNSSLNKCFKFSANKDQAPKSFIIDTIMSMLDEGYVAVVPVDTDLNPEVTDSYDILSLRTGKIVQWYPDSVQIDLYNDRTGKHELITMSKDKVAIIENPFYEIMNARNSTLQRLIRKLNLMDIIDEEAGNGKFNLILQLPYVVKTDTRKRQVEQRITDIENQLANNKYGIVYTDGTEKITQLNRSLENNMLESAKYYTDLLFTQLGMDESVIKNTASKEAMQNYYSRIIKPILETICDECTRKFITKTGLTQGQRIRYFYNTFELMPVSDIAEVADKFTRNAIITSNEMRQLIGMKPSDEPIANELSNKNLYNDDQPNVVEEEDIPERSTNPLDVPVENI